MKKNKTKKHTFTRGKKFLASSTRNGIRKIAVWEITKRTTKDGNEIVYCKTIGLIRPIDYARVAAGNLDLVMPIEQSHPFFQKKQYSPKQMGILSRMKAQNTNDPIIRLITA